MPWWIDVFRPVHPKWAAGAAPNGFCIYTPLLAVWCRWKLLILKGKYLCNS